MLKISPSRPALTARFFATISLVCCSTLANAQAFDMGVLTNTLSIDHVTQSEASRAVESEVFQFSDPSLEVDTNADLTFDYSRERTSDNLRTFVERTAAAGRSQMQALFSSQPNIVSDIGDEVRGYGIDPHNVADVYALWWMSAWLAANSRHDTPDAATISAVKAQAHSAFASTPGFAQASDADRQQYAEAMLIQTALMDAAMEEAKGKPEELAKLAQAAKQGAKASGLDLTSMTLTSEGFVPRDQADAAPATGKDTPALAGGDVQADENTSLPTYLAIAAVAGLGLGGAYLVGKKAGRG